MSVFSQWQFDFAHDVVRIGAVNNLFGKWTLQAVEQTVL